jgi:ribonuclease HI
MMIFMKSLTDLFCQHFALDPNSVDIKVLSNELSRLAKQVAKSKDTPQLDLFSSQEPNSVVAIRAYSDGACSGNPGRGGWGAVVVYLDGETCLSGAAPETTNNRMELQGAIEALKDIAQKVWEKPLDISITTDSQYVKNGITQWVHAWKKNGWKTSNKGPVKNQELWQELDRLNTQLKPTWLWIKGHAGHHYNELCDSLAVAARNQLS